jgi:hypothetical protein
VEQQIVTIRPTARGRAAGQIGKCAVAVAASLLQTLTLLPLAVRLSGKEEGRVVSLSMCNCFQYLKAVQIKQAMTQNGASSLNSEVLSELVRIIHVLLYVSTWTDCTDHGCLFALSRFSQIFLSFFSQDGWAR